MENNEKIDIEMADMIGKTYFKVATWYNKDFETEGERAEGLKHVCAEIIQQILEDTFLQIQGLGGTGVKTVKNEESNKEKTNNASGQMFQASEDAILEALGQQNNK